MRYADKNNHPIDFVIPWVDGSDREWIRVHLEYLPSAGEDNRLHRYRDWGTLQYWFRGVEKYAPWVNRVFFLTWGHIPKWLDTSHPKLRIIKHEDFISREFMPVFNSGPIELSLGNIKELSEHFVYFNDDVFLIKPTKREDFFLNGLPRDTAALAVHSIDRRIRFNYAGLEAISLINDYFDFREALKKNMRKWFSPKNGRRVLQTIYLLPCRRFPGIWQPHIATSYLKTTFNHLWDIESDLLTESCKARFRGKLGHTQYTMRCWQLASGTFEPRSGSFGKSFVIGEDSMADCESYILKGKGKVICVNDGEMSDEEFIRQRDMLIDVFENILPDKSSYER